MTVVGTLPFRRVDLGPIRGSTTALLRERGREWLEPSSPVWKYLSSGMVFFYICSLFYFRLFTLTLVSKVATMTPRFTCRRARAERLCSRCSFATRSQGVRGTLKVKQSGAALNECYVLCSVFVLGLVRESVWGLFRACFGLFARRTSS